MDLRRVYVSLLFSCCSLHVHAAGTIGILNISGYIPSIVDNQTNVRASDAGSSVLDFTSSSPSHSPYFVTAGLMSSEESGSAVEEVIKESHEDASGRETASVNLPLNHKRWLITILAP